MTFFWESKAGKLQNMAILGKQKTNVATTFPISGEESQIKIAPGRKSQLAGVSFNKDDRMRKNQRIGILAFVAAILIAVSIFYLMNNNRTDLTESEAISLLKAAYPEFKNYPNDNLPPQSIQTKQASNGWYVAFVQEGSGRPILEAKCFHIAGDETITSIGEYMPKVGEDRYDLSGENIFNIWVK